MSLPEAIVECSRCDTVGLLTTYKDELAIQCPSCEQYLLRVRETC